MSEDGERQRAFPRKFDADFAVGDEPGNRGYVGLDVLRGLISGIDDFIQVPQERWRQFRSDGPVLLACAPWITDPEFMEKLKQFSGACVVITKKSRSKKDLQQMTDLQHRNASLAGLPIRSFPDLMELAPRIDDKPTVVEPGDRWDDLVIPTIRTLGFRPRRSDRVPLMHAKLALLGNFWSHDEGPLGHVEDVTGFRPRRLWVSSANFTQASRRHIEYGFWTEDAALLERSERFLLKLIGASEGLDPDDEFKPQLLPVEYDDSAFADYVAEFGWGAEDDDEDEDY